MKSLQTYTCPKHGSFKMTVDADTPPPSCECPRCKERSAIQFSHKLPFRGQSFLNKAKQR
jgi:hypothetical protein